jgi:hypothetical protein
LKGNFLDFMRSILTSALFLIVPVIGLNAAESPAPSGGSSKSGTRPTEGTKKPSSQTKSSGGTATPAPAPVQPVAAPSEPPKRKATPSKAASKDSSSEDERFTIARKTASEDPKVKELREKADQAKNEDSGSKAMRAYLRALYGKMRALEPSLEERINLTEAAALKAVSKPE